MVRGYVSRIERVRLRRSAIEKLYALQVGDVFEITSLLSEEEIRDHELCDIYLEEYSIIEYAEKNGFRFARKTIWDEYPTCQNLYKVLARPEDSQTIPDLLPMMDSEFGIWDESRAAELTHLSDEEMRELTWLYHNNIGSLAELLEYFRIDVTGTRLHYLIPPIITGWECSRCHVRLIEKTKRGRRDFHLKCPKCQGTTTRPEGWYR